MARIEVKKGLFPLAVQTVLPSDYQNNRRFRKELETLQDLGFDGVELNIADPESVYISDIQQLLADFDLRLTMFASGLTAKTQGLSLSSTHKTIRKRSIEKCKMMIDFVTGQQAGVIIGFLKGGIEQDPAATAGAPQRMAEALAQIAPYADKQQVPILIEATNRYESPVANSLADAMALINLLQSDFVSVLPDTFHMNIEEATDIASALCTWPGKYQSIHFSDNNRCFPGLGAIDFARIVDTLKEIDYRGQIAIEGNVRSTFLEDIKACAAYLMPLLKPL